jgi:hypothetical protein
MNSNQRDNWKFTVLSEVLIALAKNDQIRANLIFKGAFILNRHLNTQRKSLDIDSNLDFDFALQHPEREAQKVFLDEHVKQAISRHFEAQNPVRYELKALRIELSPRTSHPLGWDAFQITLSLTDHAHAGVRGLPTLTVDVAAPEIRCSPMSRQKLTLNKVENLPLNKG